MREESAINADRDSILWHQLVGGIAFVDLTLTPVNQPRLSSWSDQPPPNTEIIAPEQSVAEKFLRQPVQDH